MIALLRRILSSPKASERAMWAPILLATAVLALAAYPRAKASYVDQRAYVTIPDRVIQLNPMDCRAPEHERLVITIQPDPNTGKLVGWCSRYILPREKRGES